MTAALDWDAMVERIMATTHVDRARAEEVARLNGARPPAPTADELRRDDMREKQEQAYVVRLFREFGFIVYSLSQPRASKQSIGIPDLWCAHSDRPIAFWFEVKRPRGGRFSEAQRAFADECQRCGVGYASGDRGAAEQLLIDHALAQRIGGALEPMCERSAAVRQTIPSR